jgi:hypothetical protein
VSMFSVKDLCKCVVARHSQVRDKDHMEVEDFLYFDSCTG